MAVLDYVTGTLDSARRQADRVVAPEARQRASHTVQSFAEQRPHLFVFLLAQTIFALVPVLSFAAFVLGLLTLTFVSAALFSLFWIGAAALVLTATLAATSLLAFSAWLWLLAAYAAVRFVLGLAAGGPGQRDGKPVPRSVRKDTSSSSSDSEDEYAGGDGSAAGLRGGDGGSVDAVSPGADGVKVEDGGS